MTTVRINRIVALAVIVAVGAFPITAGAAFLVNGDFETGSTSPWVINPGPFNDGIVIAPTSSFGAGIPANNGNWELFFNAGGTSAGGSASQSFGTVPGALYTVNYEFGTTASFGLQAQTLDVSVLGANGSTVLHSESHTASNLFSGTTGQPSALTPLTFTFTADGGQATLLFVDNVSSFTLNVDGVLDNVSVSGPVPSAGPAVAYVPEPSGFAFVGLSALGGTAIRARRNEKGVRNLIR